MQFLMRFLSAIFRTVLKLVLLAGAAVFVLSLLLVALASLVLILLKALLTGRKPAFVTAFVRFRQASQQFTRGGGRGRGSGPFAGSGGPSAGDVVDVQAHEVQKGAVLPHGQQPDKP
jgi:hypothetical protein